MNDPNTLINAEKALDTLVDAGLLSSRVAMQKRGELLLKLDREISYWNDKAPDIADKLNEAYRNLSKTYRRFK